MFWVNKKIDPWGSRGLITSCHNDFNRKNTLLLKLPKVTHTWQVSMQFWINSRLSSRQIISFTWFLIKPQQDVNWWWSLVWSRLKRSRLTLISVHKLKSDRLVAFQVPIGWSSYHRSKQMNLSLPLTFQDHTADRVLWSEEGELRPFALCDTTREESDVVSKTPARIVGSSRTQPATR